MNQALYAHRNNKKIKIKKQINKEINGASILTGGCGH
jgi:hypothetical protein